MINLKHLFVNNKNKYTPLRGYKHGLGVSLIFLILGSIYIWNAFYLPFGSGYDEVGHAAYIRNIAKYQTIPSPLSGWTSFHPPLYYFISSFIWNLMEPLGPAAVIVSIRMVSCLSILLVALLAYMLLKKLAFPNSVILLSTSLLLSLPAAVMAASWIGNEAWTAAASSMACVTAVLLTQKQDDSKWAFLAGIFSGLAFASKYTGIVTIIGLFAANFNLSTHRLHIRNTVLAIVGFIIISTPVLIRNVSATGTIFPMTRSLAPIARIEARAHVNRSIDNYMTFSLKCLSQPRIYNSENKTYNKHMESVWGLTYSGLWFDPFEHRLPANTSIGLVDMLPWLGLCPTFIMLVGLFDAIKDVVKSRLSQAWFPLLATAVFGLLIYIYWTWHSATLVAVKGSYLLPLIVPAASLFARGLQKINGRIRFVVIALCIIAVVINGFVLIQGLLYYAPYNLNNMLNRWMNVAYEMPYSGIYETIVWWLTGR